MIKAPRGTHDILPAEQPLARHVITTFGELAERYGYRRITTPIIEHTELIERTSGEGSDIIQKEIYTLEDRSGRSLALRPEATAPVARAYLEHGMHRDVSDRADVPLRPPAAGALPGVLAAEPGGDGIG